MKIGAPSSDSNYGDLKVRYLLTGNIWNVSDNVTDPKSTFWTQQFKDIALAQDLDTI
jgi:hypothetical protein